MADDLTQDDLLDRLDSMLANLQQHIDRRAQEVAQPLIAKAQQDAEEQVARVQDKRRRADDLAIELRRQIRSLDSQREEQRQRAVRAEAAIGRVRRLCEVAISISCHDQAADQARETLAALDGQEADHG